MHFRDCPEVAQRLADAGTPQSAPEPSQAATEAHSDEERVRKYAKEIALACGYVDPMRQHKISARAAIAVADAEQAELRAEVEALKGWLTDARAALRNMDRLLTEVNSDADRMEAAEVKVARLEALGGEPYVLADILCHLYHDYDIGDLTGFATEQGFVVSCADCKAKAREVLACLKTTLDGAE
jgi:hypothetical protein